MEEAVFVRGVLEGETWWGSLIGGWVMWESLGKRHLIVTKHKETAGFQSLVPFDT